MWVLVKYMDGSNKSVEIDKLSKLTPVEKFRELVSNEINVPANRIRFFYRGKEVVDAYEDVDGNSKKATLFDYDVQNTNTVQLMLTPEPKDLKPEKKTKDDSASGTISPTEKFATNNVKENLDSSSTTVSLEPAMSKYFKVGDLIDAKNFEIQGAWMEAKIVGISRKISLSTSSSPCRTKGSPTKSAGNVEEKNVLSSINNLDSNLLDDLVYTVEFEDNVRNDVTLKSVRPRARKKVPFDNAHIGKKIMVNYNTEYPDKVGFYYDFQVMDVKKTRTKKTVIGTIFLGRDETPVHECTIRYIDNMYEIEKTLPILARDESQKKLMMLGPSEKRMKKPDCDACLDKPNVTCKVCSCFECGGKDEPEKQLLCEECARYFHLWCLDPALEDIPEEPEWFCPYCKNNDDIVKPGQRMKSKKKDKMPSSKEGITRDWGRGMACAGRTKECTIVEKNHFGPVPGLEVGMCWEYRVMAAEAGAHRPQVAGIHGRESEGAYSIVLSGGYEDDVDEGDKFTYTGSGGRDLSGNKRTAAQSSDQLLTKMNKALALNCAASLNSKEGAEASNWKKGKPVRVLRGHKGRKYSHYCPEIGVRYDGIYKVVKYWPERGRSGFIVWRYLLMRDDTIPAPWTEEGKKRIEELGIKMEMLKQAKTPQSPLDRLKRGKTAKKRKNKESVLNDDLDLDEESPQTKKFKACAFQPPKIIEVLIEQDSANEKIWAECKTFFEQGELAFKNKLKETFNCVICQELVAHPVTLNCSHTLCQKCLARSFKSEVYQCPTCRFQLGNDFKPVINEALREILRSLFRWYDVDRG